MPTRINKFLITTGIITLIQAAFQTVYASFALAQYFCVIDFLRTYPLLIFIRILYFHNPDSCGARVNIGESIEELADQAFVLIQREPFTTERTFIINCISLGLSALWVVGSILIIKSGTRKHHSNHSHWPWLIITLAVTLLDVIAVITFANDSFHTKEIERNQVTSFEANSDDKESDEVTTRSPSVEVARIPRPGLSQSFRTMKNFLFNRTASPQAGSTNSINGGRTRNRAVNFPEEIEMTPTFENLIVEQHRRLHTAIIDTSGRRSPGQGSRLTRTLSFNNLPETSRGRRGTAVELQGQMPWSYMPAPANRMRDQLPPDEDLPPVPLPDYTAIQSARKASVHRAASSLSSITQKKEYNTSYPSPHPMATRFDVLY
ncbi:uncharacterized protein isoform X3 [Choristoneura fumiferana]|uniref:uncharacterized protein isoform X3 n=1 Tax=Choristoneura fumiferana TaxID=7141 RepID=UPI003D155B7B